MKSGRCETPPIGRDARKGLFSPLPGEDRSSNFPLWSCWRSSLPTVSCSWSQLALLDMQWTCLGVASCLRCASPPVPSVPSAARWPRQQKVWKCVGSGSLEEVPWPVLEPRSKGRGVWSKVRCLFGVCLGMFDCWIIVVLIFADSRIYSDVFFYFISQRSPFSGRQGASS